MPGGVRQVNRQVNASTVPANPDFYDAPGRVEGSYNAANAGSNGPAPGWATDTIRNRYTDAMKRTGGVAQRAEDAYLDRAEGFDATSYLNTAARGAFNQFMPEFERSIGELRGQQVGMGRLDTGFATEDEDRLVTQSMGRFTDQLSGMALDAGRMQIDNDQGLANFGAEYGNRYLDMISGQYDRKTAETNAKKNKFWNDLGGVADIAGSAAAFI